MNSPKRIMFLGGSITVGGVASDYSRSWARLTYERIAGPLFGGNCEMLNASLSGTGSFFAAMRLSRHVLPYRPHMVFVEFAVNDFHESQNDPQTVISSLDYIVRRLTEANPETVIVFVYTSLSGKNASETYGIVAKHHNIPEIDLQTPLKKLIEAENKSWRDYMPDGVHPNDEGHRFYADVVSETVLGNRERFLTPTRPSEKPLSTHSFRDPQIIPVSSETEQSGFELVPGDDMEELKHLPELVIRNALYSEKEGATVTVRFEGTHFGIYHRIGGKMGRAEVRIDGEFVGILDCFYSYADPKLPGEYCCFFRKHGITPGKHVAEIRVLGEKNEKSNGNRVVLAGFLAG